MVNPIAPIADGYNLEWEPHPRFDTIGIKRLITSDENPLASLNLVKVPPQGVIGRHVHQDEIETVYVLTGESVLTLVDRELPFSRGQVVSIPKGMEHALRNESEHGVELLTIFTPPLD